MTALRRVGALLLLLVLLVGVPWGLSEAGSFAGLQGLDWGRLWTTRDDGSLLVSLLTLVGWLAWGCFALATVAELVALVSRRRVRLPGLGWAQAVAGGLLVAVVSAPVSPPPAAASPALPPAPATAAAPAAAAAAPAADIAGPTYTVRAGDDLWSIAERLLGDGLRWRAIWELNSERVPDPDHIEAGWVLRLPNLPETGEHPAEPPREEPGGAASGGVTPPGGHVSSRPTPGRGETTAIAPTQNTSVPAPVGPSVPPAQATHDSSTPGPSAPPAATREPSAPSAATREPSAPPAATREQSTPEGSGAAAVRAGAVASVSLGALGASSILAALALRRRSRDNARPVGRRFLDPSPAAQRLESVLASRAASVGPDDLALVRRVAAEHGRDRGLPHLVHALVAADRIVLTFTDDAPLAPIGLVASGRTWTVPASGLEYLRADEDTPLAWPAMASVGETDDGTVLVDLAEAGTLGVPDDAVRKGLLAGLLASDGLDLIVVGRDPLVAAFEAAGARCIPDAAAARGLLAGPALPREAQLDRDLADAARPRVVVATTPVPELADLVTEGACVVVAPTDAAWRLEATGLTTPWGDLALTPAHLDDDAARDLTELVASAASTQTEPAPWWAHDDGATVTWLRPRPSSPLLVSRLSEDHVTDPAHPTLGLLGPIELRGARGEPPPRAVKQCIEYAAWLLEHPGATASQMSSSLLVAEGTRRSNMSRLRAWLGADDDGRPYLPEAYSGRILLSPGVGSDWHRLQLLVGPGVNRVSPDSLAAALDLVRGAPLADAAPGQWVWAEPMRSDMVALVRDIAATLARAALDAGDLDLVRWATARGLVVAPGDEVLTVLRVRAEHRAGNDAEVDRLVQRLATHARRLGVDLAEETVIALQEVLEGQARARRLSH